jgi:hypothetical protein
VVLFLQNYPPNFCLHFCSPEYIPHALPIYPRLFYHLNNFLMSVIYKAFIIQFSIITSYFTNCSLKYIPQHLTLEHFQPVFFPQCERPRFVPLKITGGTILFVCLYSTFELLNHLVNCHILIEWFTIGNLYL